MTVCNKVLVGWETREVASVVLKDPVVDLTQGLLLDGEQVKNKDGDDFAVAKRGLPATTNHFERKLVIYHYVQW